MVGGMWEACGSEEPPPSLLTDGLCTANARREHARLTASSSSRIRVHRRRALALGRRRRVVHLDVFCRLQYNKGMHPKRMREPLRLSHRCQSLTPRPLARRVPLATAHFGACYSPLQRLHCGPTPLTTAASVE